MTAIVSVVRYAISLDELSSTALESGIETGDRDCWSMDVTLLRAQIDVEVATTTRTDVNRGTVGARASSFRSALDGVWRVAGKLPLSEAQRIVETSAQLERLTVDRADAEHQLEQLAPYRHVQLDWLGWWRPPRNREQRPQIVFTTDDKPPRDGHDDWRRVVQVIRDFDRP